MAVRYEVAKTPTTCTVCGDTVDPGGLMVIQDECVPRCSRCAWRLQAAVRAATAAETEETRHTP